MYDKMLKKVFALLAAFVLTATLAGCGTSEPEVFVDDDVIVVFEDMENEVEDLILNEVEIFVDDLEIEDVNYDEDVVVVDVDSFDEE